MAAFHGFHTIARCVFVIREEDSSYPYEQLVLLFNAVGMFGSFSLIVRNKLTGGQIYDFLSETT